MVGGFMFFGFFMLLIFFLIFVAIARWIFRINDIVERLDRVIGLLKRLPNTVPEPGSDVCPSCKKADFYYDSTAKIYCPNCKAYIQPVQLNLAKGEVQS